MNKIPPLRALLCCSWLVCGACASTGASPDAAPVAFYNAYRTGSEALPTAIEGVGSPIE